MLKVGITGGIGSGKTTVCKIFEVIGIPVYYADTRAKLLMEQDEALVTEIKALFGAEAYSGKKLNRAYLSGKVFNNKLQLNKLNAIVHPAVFRDVEKWMSRQNDKPYAIEEAALLFETGSYKKLDKTIMVYAPPEERIKRVQKRDGATREEVISRMKHQLNDDEKLKLADFVIYNDNQHKIILQTLAIHHILLQSSR